MGVTGLWQVVQPCARPIKLETLNRKRLAVDASIWIYQFLKAVRDKEGNALRNSHVVGFFRRICKLLFFGIKPVFVFDGGAPTLKRQTITARKARREGRREDAARTAGRLLAVQMQRRAEEEDRKQREQRDHPAAPEEEEVPDDLVYTEELLMTEKERKQNRTFKKKDAYHLPDLDVSLSEMGAPNDPRIMSHEELEEYARQFHTGEDINLYDFSKIDFSSPFFQSLPAADRYNILNAARLRSRLRMGYSKEQLDDMFPDRMAFSKFQIERVKERNELTQRLMNLNGMMGDMFINGTQRVAGERGKEYVLVKNDGVEGGWALGVVSNKNEGQRNQPIDVDTLGTQIKDADDDWEDEEDFEDIPMEGINRLPKQSQGQSRVIQPLGSTRARLAVQNADSQSAMDDHRPTKVTPEAEEDDPEDLFLPDDAPKASQHDEDEDVFFEDVLPATANSDDEDLQRAIAMSLEKDNGDEAPDNSGASVDEKTAPKLDYSLDFNEKSASAGRAFAQVSNTRAQASVTNPKFDNAFANTTARRLSPPGGRRRQTQVEKSPAEAPSHGFSGPLPFESLNLGGSFLRKKKKTDDEGGFDKDDSKKKEHPLPPWFSGTDVREGAAEQTAMDIRQMVDNKDQGTQEKRALGEPLLRKQNTNEVIEIDGTQQSRDEDQDIVDIDSPDGESDDIEMGEVRISEKVRQPIVIDSPPRMEDIAENIKIKPPSPAHDAELAAPNGASNTTEKASSQEPAGGITDSMPLHEQSPREEALEQDENYEIEWSDSDVGDQDDKSHEAEGRIAAPSKPVSKSSSPEPEFEDVTLQDRAPESPKLASLSPAPAPVQEAPESQLDNEPTDPAIDDEFSDSEDEELMRQLATEAEEHARFAASLNAAASKQSVEEYERELRQLRTQQKKDRRDADEVSHIMITECQQLLRLFGLPYITAPMEAEAQCAELVHLGLVDGIVTDDSDIFLFGGTRVYKNMFNQAKFVECYIASDLEKEYSLTREKIVQMAHLLGSDYTEGLPGVGPVSALEILSEFPDLTAFHEWWTDVQSGTNQPPPSELKQSSFRKKFRKNVTKLFLPPGFPDPRVDDAYLHPEVDRDDMPFQWGVPDLDALRTFLMQTIGWNRERTDEVLVPVVRDMNRRDTEGTQANITRFFTGSAGTGAGRMRGLAGDHGRAAMSEQRGGAHGTSANTADSRPADTDADAAAEAFAPRRRNVGGSKRMETALGKLHQQAQAAQRAESSRKRRTADDTTGGDGADGPAADGEDEVNETPRPRKAVRKVKGRKKQ